MDIWAVAQAEDPKSMDDVPVWVKPMITPMKAEITAIAVEYGLHEGRFWLPRLRLAEGSAQVSFMHVPFKMEESFKYASVNAKDTLADDQASPTPDRARMPDSLTVEQQAAVARLGSRMRARARASARRTTRFARVCEKRDVRRCAVRHVGRSRRDVASLRLADCPIADARFRATCRSSRIRPDLPASIYDPGEELFGAKELEALKAEALSMSAQAPF